MKAFDKNGHMVDANGIRFVVRESGYFELVTAFPIFIDSISSTKTDSTSSTKKIENTGNMITRIKDFIDFESFPNTNRIAIMLEKNNGQTLAIMDGIAGTLSDSVK